VLSEGDLDPNGTYTEHQRLSPLNVDSPHREPTGHVITMPLTPPDNSETVISGISRQP